MRYVDNKPTAPKRKRGRRRSAEPTKRTKQQIARFIYDELEEVVS